MDNKKLFKFLYKDIAEIEELFAEKGAEGFDQYEMEFIQSRFSGAKQIIQILSEKENKQLKNIRPRPTEVMEKEEDEVDIKSDEEEEVVIDVAYTAEKEEEQETPVVEEEIQPEVIVEKEETEPAAEIEEEKAEDITEVEEEQPTTELVNEKIEEEEPAKEVELEEKTVEANDANNRLGDSFVKEKSVNDLLSGGGNNLEQKISNSAISSIQSAIGINDRYQYIRELFNGDADLFAKAVADLDQQNSLQEAVNYLQENHTWTKNDVSLKFVNLIKRRFPNG